METLKAVIFDLDDTLLDWRGHNADRLEVRHIHVRPLYEHLSDTGHLTTTLEEFGFFRNRRGGNHGKSQRARIWRNLRPRPGCHVDPRKHT